MKKKFTTNLSLTCLTESLPFLRYHLRVKYDNEIIEMLIKEKVDEINNEMAIKKQEQIKNK